MRHSVAALLSGAALALAAAPSSAQTPSTQTPSVQAPGGQAASAPAPSEEAMSLARQIVQAVGGQANMKAVMRAAFDQILSSMPKTGTADQQAKQNALLVYARDWMDGHSDQLADASARVYAQTFTEQELRDILAFYRTPTGRSMASKTPVLARATVTAITPTILAFRRDIMLKACDLNACKPEQVAKIKAAFGNAPATP